MEDLREIVDRKRNLAAATAIVSVMLVIGLIAFAILNFVLG